LPVVSQNDDFSLVDGMAGDVVITILSCARVVARLSRTL
jgi:hypothetical protein